MEGGGVLKNKSDKIFQITRTLSVGVASSEIFEHLRRPINAPDLRLKNMKVD